MIIVGLVLAVLGALFAIPIVETVGIVLLVVGVALLLLGAVGRPVGGRRYWF